MIAVQETGVEAAAATAVILDELQQLQHHHPAPARADGRRPPLHRHHRRPAHRRRALRRPRRGPDRRRRVLIPAPSSAASSTAPGVSSKAPGASRPPVSPRRHPTRPRRHSHAEARERSPVIVNRIRCPSDRSTGAVARLGTHGLEVVDVAVLLIHARLGIARWSRPSPRARGPRSSSPARGRCSARRRRSRAAAARALWKVGSPELSSSAPAFSHTGFLRTVQEARPGLLVPHPLLLGHAVLHGGTRRRAPPWPAGHAPSAPLLLRALRSAMVPVSSACASRSACSSSAPSASMSYALVFLFAISLRCASALVGKDLLGGPPGPSSRASSIPRRPPPPRPLPHLGLPPRPLPPRRARSTCPRRKRPP